MKKIMFVLAMVCFFISKPVMASYLYSFEGAPASGMWSISWSWEFSSESIFSTDTSIAGNLLTDKESPAGYDIVSVRINPNSGSYSWVFTDFDTNGDGVWDMGYGVGFDADIAQVGFFTNPNNDQITLKISEQTVPEPATLALFGIALAGFGATRRRKQS